MSLVDMLTNAMGVQNPLGASSGQPPANPYALSAQLGGTPQTLPNGQPNPQYSQLQQQVQQAQSQEAARARAMGLISAGASMLGARDPHTGKPAGFGYALGQGIEGGVQGDQNYYKNEQARSMAALQAQQAGQGLAQGAQAQQMGQMKLADAQVLQKAFGVSDPQTLKYMADRNTAQAQMAALQKILQDPQASDDLKQRAMLAMPGLQSGQPNPKLSEELLPKLESPEAKELKEAQAAYNRAGVTERGKIGDYYSGMGAGGVGGKVDTEVWRRAGMIASNAFKMSPETAKLFGAAPGPAATTAIAQQIMGEWPPGFPPHDFIMQMVKSGRLAPGRGFSIGPNHYIWDGKFLIPGGAGIGEMGGGEPGESAEGATEPGAPVAEAP